MAERKCKTRGNQYGFLDKLFHKNKAVRPSCEKNITLLVQDANTVLYGWADVVLVFATGYACTGLMLQNSLPQHWKSYHLKVPTENHFNVPLKAARCDLLQRVSVTRPSGKAMNPIFL